MDHRPTSLLLLWPFAFLIVMISAQDMVCSRPKLAANIEMDGIQRLSSPGVEVPLSCKQGYTSLLGPRKIVCTIRGEWTKTKFMCIPKTCPSPDLPSNGELYYEDTVYQSTVNYTCNEGYILTGASTVTCLASGRWSAPTPECKPVSCGLAPIPQFGMIIYDRLIRGDTIDYGVTGTYRCRPPYALFGNTRAECTARGKWTEAPECRKVSCPPPGDINEGFMSVSLKQEFDFMDKVNYGCNGDYVLQGNLQIVCQQNGNWSEKPSCKAPCRVDVQRGRILYKGQKLWIEDLQPNKVLHEEIVSVYCKDKDGKCGYAVSTQCIDGVLKIPECFEEPSGAVYNLYPNTLPSEIKQC